MDDKIIRGKYFVSKYKYIILNKKEKSTIGGTCLKKSKQVNKNSDETIPV